MHAAKRQEPAKSKTESRADKAKPSAQAPLSTPVLNPVWSSIATHVSDGWSAAGANNPPSPQSKRLNGPCIQRFCSACAENAKDDEPAGVQTKLTLATPDDDYEREADGVAERVMRMADSDAQGEPEEDMQQEPVVQTKSSLAPPLLQPKGEASGTPSAGSRSVQAALSAPGAGAALQESLRSRVEPVLGADLSQVRVHSDTPSQLAARDLNAKAFTHQNHIYLGAGQRAEDVGLMAHELTHVQQQGFASPASADRHDALVQRFGDEDEEPAPRPPTMNVPVQPPGRAERETGPTISAAPLESFADFVMEFPDMELLARQSYEPEWTAETGRMNLVAFPTEIGVVLEAGANLGAYARFNAALGPARFRNVRAGVNARQYYLLTVARLLGPLRQVLTRSYPQARRMIGDFVVEGELSVPANVSLTVGARGELEAAASLLGVLDLVTLGGGLNAEASAEAQAALNLRGQFMFRDGVLDIDHSARASLDFQLRFALQAFLEASLLGFDIRHDWELLRGNFWTLWQVGSDLDFVTNSNGERQMRINVEEMEERLRRVGGLVREMFSLENMAMHAAPPRPSGGHGGLCLPPALPHRRNSQRGPGNPADPSDPVNEDAGGIDNTLRYMTRERRISIAGLSYEDFQRKNEAVGKVRIDGEPRYLGGSNVPGTPMHSEDAIIAGMQGLARGGRRVVLTQLYSERIPCGNCIGQLNRWRAGGLISTANASIWYAIPYPDRDLGGRANDLMVAYCLRPPPQRPPTE